MTADGHIGSPLGVGSIVGESFSILFRNFITVLMLAFIPTLAGLVISGLTAGWGVTLGTGDTDFGAEPNWAGIALGYVVQMVIYGVTTALLVQFAYDAKLSRPINVSRYFGPALSAALPIAILGLVAALAMGIGMIFLIIPGLWVYAVFSMIAPAIVIEKVGYGALGRSAALTKGYRWPILGVIILVGICTFLLSFVTVFIAGLVGAATGGGVLVMLVITAVVTSVGYGLGGISVSLIYARLREIKEGVSVDQIASVFD